MAGLRWLRHALYRMLFLFQKFKLLAYYAHCALARNISLIAQVLFSNRTTIDCAVTMNIYRSKIT